MAQIIEYKQQRAKKTPPHVPLRAVRMAAKLTLETVCGRVSEHLGKPFSAGALSAIENGHRGPSPEVVTALEVALDLYPGALTVDYEPAHSRRKASA